MGFPKVIWPETIKRDSAFPEINKGVSTYVFNPLDLFGVGDVGVWYDFTTVDHIRQNSNGTGVVSALDDPIGWVEDLAGGGYHATQATGTARPLWKEGYAKFDLLDDFITSAWPTITIGTIAIITKRGVFFDDQYVHTGTFDFAKLSAPQMFIEPHTYYTGGIRGLTDAISSGLNNLRMVGILAIDRVLSEEEKQQLQDYYLPLGCPGRIVISPNNYIVNNSFDSGQTSWTRSSALANACVVGIPVAGQISVTNNTTFGGTLWQNMADLTPSRSFVARSNARSGATVTTQLQRMTLYRQSGGYSYPVALDVTSGSFAEFELAGRSVDNTGFRVGISVFKNGSIFSSQIVAMDYSLYPIIFPVGYGHE